MRALLPIIFAALLFNGAIPAPSEATTLFASCNYTCTSNCQLTRTVKCCNNAFLCDGNASVTLSGGADLDLHGYSLQCFCGQTTCNGGTNNNAQCTTSSECPGGTCTDSTGCTSCAGPAVVVSGSGSVVTNSVPASGGIVGPFSYAVDCASKTGSSVSGIRIDGVQRWGVQNCAHVDNNIITAGAIDGFLTQGGIVGGAIANTDTITSNFVQGFRNYAIEVTGAKSSEVSRNIIKGREAWPGYYGEVGIEDASSAATITGNLFVGDPDTLYDMIEPTTGGNPGNYCDDRLDGSAFTYSCFGCKAFGNCVDPNDPPPFVFGH